MRPRSSLASADLRAAGLLLSSAMVVSAAGSQPSADPSARHRRLTQRCTESPQPRCLDDG